MCHLYGCKTTTDSFYCYKVSTYTIDSVKHLLTSRSLISYGDYLFEFKNRIKINSIKRGDKQEEVTSFKIDTTGIYLLSNKNAIYYEYDTFELKSRIIQTGKLDDKPFGVRFSPDSTNSTEKKGIIHTPPVEVVMNNIKCYYSEILSKDKSGVDSVTVKVLLIKKKNFNSLYKLRGERFIDKNYCIVGLELYDYKQKQGLSDVIDALRPLTEKEKEICESMVQKSKTCVTDTIKGLNLKH